MTPRSGSAHVLVVDDDEPIAAALRRALEYEGLRVSVARDGVTALDLARRDPPVLVVLDVMLTGLDGVQVCEQLRADQSPALVHFLSKDGGNNMLHRRQRFALPSNEQ